MSNLFGELLQRFEVALLLPSSSVFLMGEMFHVCVCSYKLRSSILLVLSEKVFEIIDSITNTIANVASSGRVDSLLIVTIDVVAGWRFEAAGIKAPVVHTLTVDF